MIERLVARQAKPAPRPRTSRIITFGLAAVLATFVTPQQSASAEAPALDGIASNTLDAALGEHWYGVYMGARKIGHARMWFQRATTDDPTVGYLNGTEVVMRVFGAGSADALRVLDERAYGNKPPFALVRASYRSQSSGVVDERKLVEKNGGWWVQRILNGKTQPERPIGPSRETLRDQMLLLNGSPSSLRPGASFSGYTFSWDLLSDLLLKAHVVGKEERVLSGIRAQVTLLELTYEKDGKAILKARAELSDGAVLEMSIGPQIVIKLEERAIAQASVVGLDVANAGVQITRELGDPSRIDELELELRLPEGFSLPVRGNREAMERAGGRTRLKIRRAPGARLTDADRKAALTSNLTIDHDAPPILAKSKSLLKGKIGRRKRVKALSRYVFRNLRKRLATNLPSASVVLEKNYGDCTEHTWLFVALARAANIPARPVYGVAYAGKGQRRFAYHAWAEVEIDGRWHELDPTWGEDAADATHLQLGSDLISTVPALGGIEIRVLSFRSRRSEHEGKAGQVD